jgi:SAM-dependent methyltransferase/uncharacterized membrane protein YbhN (UPF0104 family)
LLTGITLLAILIWFVRLDWHSVGSLLTLFNARILLVLGVLYAAPQAIRVGRLSVLLPRAIPLKNVTSIVLVHQLLACSLPLKLGELTLPALLDKEGVRPARSLAVLAFSRMLDLVTVVTLLNVALVVFWNGLPTTIHRLEPLIRLLGVAGVVLLVVAVAARAPVRRTTARVARWLHQRTILRGVRAWWARQSTRFLGSVTSFPLTTTLSALLMTTVLWCLLTSFNVVFCRHFAPQVASDSVILVVLLMPLLNHLPIHAWAGIGTTHAVIVALFSMVGMDPREALALGIVGHAFHYGLMVAFGLLGLAMMRTGGQRRPGTTARKADDHQGLPGSGTARSARTPPRDPAAAVEHYAHGYHSALLSRMMSDAEYYEIKAFCAARQYFGRFPAPHGRILEFGCGIGQNIAALTDAVGYDVSPEAVEECTRRGIATIAQVDDIPEGHYDFVLCRHVLEHVEQPLDVLRQLLSYLRTDGTLILVLPKEGHRRVPLDVDIHRHLYCWTFRTINNLIHLADGVPVFNAWEPMFGVRTHVLLRPLLGTLGQDAYYRMARLAGHVFGDTELVIHAKRQA